MKTKPPKKPTHVINPEVIAPLELKAVSAPKDPLLAEIKAWVDQWRGRTLMPREAVEQTFALYNRYYAAGENNYTCFLCLARIFTKLEALVAGYDA